MKGTVRLALFLLAGATLLVLSLSLGSTVISPAKAWKALTGDGSSLDYLILVNLRIPRVLMALLVGSSLAVSGALFQSLLKNPLSDPYTVGVSGGAAFGATVAIALSLGNFFITLFAFGGSLLAVSLVYALSRKRIFSGESLILTGLAVSFILSSGVLLIFTLVRAESVHRALLWLMGDLSLARYDLLGSMGLFPAALILLAMAYSRHLNIISFGEEFSRNLGVRDRDIRNLFWIASLLSALSVSMAGTIGFAGLIVPHMMRSLFGPHHARLLPASAVGGGIFVMACDAFGRSVHPPYEIPVGIITGFLGGIFFLFILLRRSGGRP